MGQPCCARPCFRIGLFLLTLSCIVQVLGLMLTTSREQALTPGEKNLGVAALFILWSLPVLFFGVAGVCFLLVSTSVFLYRKLRRPRSSVDVPDPPCLFAARSRQARQNLTSGVLCA